MWKTENYTGPAGRSCAGACKVGEAKYHFSTRKKRMHSWNKKNITAPVADDDQGPAGTATA